MGLLPRALSVSRCVPYVETRRDRPEKCPEKVGVVTGLPPPTRRWVLRLASAPRPSGLGVVGAKSGGQEAFLGHDDAHKPLVLAHRQASQTRIVLVGHTT